MKILVTGGAGFIGHHVVKALEVDHDVAVIDNRETYRGMIDSQVAARLYKERTLGIKSPVFVKDIRDLQKTNQAIFTFKPEVVIHLAAAPRAKVVDHDPVASTDTMTTALMNLLLSSSHCGARRFVYISSSMVYGNFKGDATEEDDCNPIGMYAVLKLTGEQMVKDWCSKHGMEYTIIRPSAVYGPMDIDDRVIAKFLTTAMWGGALEVAGKDEFLDFTYVTDTAEGIVKASTSAIAANQTYNISRGDSKTLLRAAEICVHIAKGGHIEIKDRNWSFPKRGTLDITKAQNDLSFYPLITLEQGLAKYYQYLKE